MTAITALLDYLFATAKQKRTWRFEQRFQWLLCALKRATRLISGSLSSSLRRREWTAPPTSVWPEVWIVSRRSSEQLIAKLSLSIMPFTGSYNTLGFTYFTGSQISNFTLINGELYRVYQALVVWDQMQNIAFCSASVRSVPAIERVAEGVTKGSPHANAEAALEPQPNPTTVRSIDSRYYAILVSSGSRGNRGNVPSPKTGKFAKDGEQSMPQPAMKINNMKIFKFSLNFSKILLKFS